MRKIIITESQLRRVIKQTLDINETLIGGEFTAYHGTDKEIEKFTDEFVGTEEATDQEGPGIYFTTDYDDARGYGKIIYSVILRPNKLVDESSTDEINPEELERMIKTLSDWESAAQNWNEDPDSGLRIAINDFFEYNDTEKDVFQQMWIEFFRYNPVQFVKGMVNLGYDGQLIKKENGRQHVIVYNPDIIETTNIERN